MKIIETPLDEIRPYKRNAKKHDAKQVANVAESIRQYGFVQPIVVDRDGVIVIGHCRYAAAKKLGMNTVPCVCVDELTPEQVDALRIVDNKTNESPWDFDLLSADLPNLDLSAFDFDFGIPSMEECADDESVEPEDQTEDIPQAVEDEPPEVDETAEPITKLGDIWQLGRHRLMCGDSTDKATVELLMDGKKAEMVLSDPPYGMFLDTDFSDIKGSMKSIGRKNHTHGNKYDKVIGDNEDFKPELITTFFDNFGYCKEMFLFGADYFAEIIPNKNDGSWLVWDKRKESQANAIGSEFELCWSKSKHKRRMLRHDWFGFLSSQNGADARNRVHPTQKPVTLLADIIEQWGKDCENIVDLYGGSGSTLIACEQLNRTCYMMEIDPKYCDVIIKRWETLTGEKAIKI